MGPFTRGLLFATLILALATAVVFPVPSASAVSDATCVDTSRVFLESQGWWVTDGNDQGNNFGHVHVGTCFPLFQKISGTVEFDLKLQLHDNPGSLTHVQPFICANEHNTDCYTAPDVRFTPPLTCAVATCVFYRHIAIDTTKWPYDGMNSIRFRTEVSEPDGNVLRAANNWLVNIRNGNPVKTWADGPNYVDGRGWYRGSYSNAKVYKGYSPNPSSPFTVTYKCGSSSEPVVGCLVAVDPSFHAVPPDFGTILKNNAIGKVQTVTVTPAQYAAGLHSLVFRTCVHDSRSVPGKDAHRCGVLKLPFSTP